MGASSRDLPCRTRAAGRRPCSTRREKAKRKARNKHCQEPSKTLFRTGEVLKAWRFDVKVTDPDVCRLRVLAVPRVIPCDAAFASFSAPGPRSVV